LARRFTLTTLVAAALLGMPNFLSCLAHARVDSEVGVMMNGFPLLLGIMFVAPVVGVSTIIWGLGLRQARLQSEQVPLLERCFFGAIAAVLLFVLWGFSAEPLHRAMSCAAL
jgi:hypothetical protein